MSLCFSTLCFIFALLYDMHITKPHPCMQPCKRSEWGEQVHFPGYPSGLKIQSKLGCVTQNAKCIFNSISVHILCLVYTVQPLDNNFITFLVNFHKYEHFGRKGFACATQILYTTRSHSPHNAPHSPSCNENFAQVKSCIPAWKLLTVTSVVHGMKCSKVNVIPPRTMARGRAMLVYETPSCLSTLYMCMRKNLSNT